MSSIKQICTLLFVAVGLNSYSQCPTLVMSGTPVDCYGNSNGSASVTITGANLSNNITTSWSNGANTNTINGLTAGSYTVIVKDNVSGCSSSGVYVVNTPDPISIPFSVNEVACFGAATGSIVLSPAGGTLPYTFDWNTDVTGDYDDAQNQTNLTSGFYNVEIRDVNDCTASKTIFVNQPNGPLEGNVVKEDVSCFGGNDGSVELTTFGGTTPYSYTWNNGEISEDISNLSAGTYIVSIVDNKSCSNTKEITISAPQQLSAITNNSPVLCADDLNGSVGVTVSGGTAPYSYSWENSSFVISTDAASLSNVKADSYEVTITDANGCQLTASETIGSPTPLVAQINSTDVSCFNGNDGSIELIVSGGTPLYTLNWSDNNGSLLNTTATLDNLSANTYTVTINDANNCNLTLSREVLQPTSPVIINAELTNVNCYGENTGAIEISVTGGTFPYNYNWTNGETSATIDNLLPDDYTINITDNNNCVYSESYTITQPSDTLSATHVLTEVNCFGESNGSINLIPAGGTAPYSFSWSNSSFQLSDQSEDLINYPADTYFLEMIDAKNCVFLDTLEILQPTQLQNTLVDLDVLCKNDATGAIDQTITGGVTPYNILWSNGQTTEDLSNLEDNWYTVTVTDFNGCIVIDSTEITEPLDTISYTFIKKDVLCNNGNTGEIEINVSGGTVPYLYLWNTTDTLPTINDLTAGIYTFLVTDNNGCTFTDSIEITQPDPLVLNEVITAVTCFGLSDGNVDISPIGGTAPYSYTWLNSAFQLATQTEDLINFPADIYQLELRDTFNCLTEVFIEIPQPEVLTTTLTSVDITCAGGSDGSIDISVVGGNPGYNYLWSDGSITEDLNNLPIGTYTVYVTDTKNCEDSISVTLSEPDSIKIDFDIFNVSCADQKDGMATALPYGGTGSFIYDWNDPISQDDKIENLYGGTYTVTVTDIVGCTATDSAKVLVTPIVCLDPPNAFSPNNDGYNDVWNIQNIELYPNATVQIYNRWGNILYESKGSYTAWDGIINGQPLPAETYYYIINANYKELEPLKGTLNIIR